MRPDRTGPVVVVAVLAATLGRILGHHDDYDNTVENEECPQRVTSCTPYERYRTYDGSCTNPFKPPWGLANSNYIYLLGPEYDDGVQAPKTSVNHVQLPSARSIKNEFFQDGENLSEFFTLLVMTWGQFLAHDISMQKARNQDATCCATRGNRPMGDDCYPIWIPPNDHFMWNSSCINFRRVQSDLSLGCRDWKKTQHPALPINEVTPAIDLSHVYSNSERGALNLREMVGGLLRSELRNNYTYPPTEFHDSTCRFVYETGDQRANQNAPLLLLHVAFINYHNSMATKLSRLNPHWDDNRLFEETRRIMIAIFQYITYYKWLPIIMGREVLLKAGIIYKNKTYVKDFSPFTNLAATNEYSHAASRILHNLIPNCISRYSRDRNLLSTILLSDNLFCQDVLEERDAAKEISVGTITQPMKDYGTLHVDSITQRLFERAGRSQNADLRSIDIQRGRDVGLQSYVKYLKLCRFVSGGKNEQDWSIFQGIFGADVFIKLQMLYASPDAVDLSTGLGLEPRVPGTHLGPTSICIFVDQFLRLRNGDYRWFEHPESEFTSKQIRAIKNVSLARLLCESWGLEEIQRHPFYLLSDRNPLRSCNEMREFNIAAWMEVPF